MKSQSDRRNKSSVVSNPRVQTNPNVWVPEHHGFPSWLNLAGFKGKVITPSFDPALRAAMTREGFLPHCVEMDQCEILKVRSRANPWHPSGRLEALVLKKWIAGDPGKKKFLQFTLKFHGADEQIECTDAFTYTELPAAVPVHTFKPLSKYTGPRQAGDTKSAVSGNKRKSP